MEAKCLDKFLTEPPDNGYQKWEDSVMALVDVEIDEEKAVDELNKLSLAGTNGQYPNVEFSASVIRRRCAIDVTTLKGIKTY